MNLPDSPHIYSDSSPEPNNQSSDQQSLPKVAKEARSLFSRLAEALHILRPPLMSSVELVTLEEGTTTGGLQSRSDNQKPLAERCYDRRVNDSPDNASGITSDTLDTSEEDGDDAHDEYPEGGWQAYLVVLGAFLGCLVNLGVINSIGAVQMWVLQHQLVNYLALTISWVFSIYLALSYLLAVVSGPLFDRYGPRWVMWTSTALIFLGMMLVANSEEIWQFILAFIALGLGNGLGMSPSIGIITHWFMKKRGLVLGIATSGGSVGGLVFPLMLRYAYAKYGFVWAIRIFAFTTGGCMVIASLLCKERFRSAKKVHDPNPTPSTTKSNMFLLASMKQLIANLNLDRKYCVLVVAAYFGEISLILIVTYYATYSVAKGVSESTALLLLTVWNAAGIPGRWIPGWLSDYMGRFNMNFLMVALYAIFIWVLWFPFGGHLGALYAFAVMGGFFSGSILSLLPACVSQITPVRDIGKKYGLMNGVLSIANLFGVPIASAIIHKGTLLDYDHFVIFVACLATCGAIFWGVDRCLVGGIKPTTKV